MRAESLGLDFKRTLGLGLHGDGAPISKKHSMLMFSVNLVAQPHKERYLCTSISKHLLCPCGSCKGKHTIDAITHVLVWSFKVCLLGVLPHWGPGAWKGNEHVYVRLDRAGFPAGEDLGCNALLVQCRGDWQWYCQLFGLNSWSATEMCWKCRAKKQPEDPLYFGNFCMDAAWRATCVSDEAYLQEQSILSPMFQAPGFLPSDICVDVLHTLDLGCTQDLIGNVFVEVMDEWEGSQAETLAKLRGRMKEFYALHNPPSKLNTITKEMLRKKASSPKLKAKGAETRYLLPFALELCQLSYDPANNHKVVRERCCRNMLTFYMEMAKENFDPSSAKAAAQSFLLDYSFLSTEAREKGLKMWALKPKFHLFAHLGESQVLEVGNPRLFWAYADESFMGQLSRMARPRGGKQGAKATYNLLQKFRAWTSTCKAQ
jgi:hypothetical protein